jgi:hypothetical protein
VPLSLASFHFHPLCDILRNRGPDGHQRPIPYLAPFFPEWQLAWDGQWALNAWQNVAPTALLIATILHQAWKRGRSPVGIYSDYKERPEC